MRSLPRRALTVLLLYALGGSPAAAQSNLETNAGIRLNFSTPGARSLGLGGAFIGLADDATAAYSNPAGLTQLVDPEVATEGRLWEFTHVYTDRGRLEGYDPTDKGVDKIRGLQDGEARDRVMGASFLSVVFPGRRWTAALYRHELAHFQANFKTQGAFLRPTRSRSPLGFPGEEDGRLASLRNEMDLEIDNYGLTVAYRFADRHLPGRSFAFGVGLSFYTFSLESRAWRHVPNLYDEPDFAPDMAASIQEQLGDDSDWSYAAGFLWQVNEKWNVGGVYRQGPTFGFEARNRPGPASRVPFPESVKRGLFHVPDFYGVGIAVKPSQQIRVTFDYARVEYSDLMEGFVDVFNLEELYPGQDPELEAFRIDDADELHLGFEYAFYPAAPLILRLGAWYDPDHNLRFDGNNEALRAIYRHGGDETHFSAGIGIPLQRIQFDLALDNSERSMTVSLSTVVRF